MNTEAVQGWRLLRSMTLLFVMLTVLTGLVYPLLVTGIAQLVWPGKANGSPLMRQGRLVGSQLLGQPFSAPGYFWSRPSASTPQPYNGESSSGSNLGPTNPAQALAVQQRIAALRAADPDNRLPVPVDLVTASASGLDPHITPAAARYQLARVARVRGVAATEVAALVDRYTEGRTFGLLGEPRVNVVELNLALDARQAGR